MDKDRAKAKELFQQMSLRQKIVYIWQEFRWPILAVIIAVAVTAYITVDLINKEQPVLYGLAINGTLSRMDEFREELETALQTQKKECVSLSDQHHLQTDQLSDPYSMTYATGNQIICAAAVQELDFVFTDIQGLEFLHTQELYTDPTSLLSESQQSLLYCVQGQPVALDLSGTAAAERIGWEGDTLYLVLPNLAQRDEQLKILLSCLLE